MSNTYYTIYWINKRDDVRKEHGTYKSEDDAKEAILTWWEINQEDYDYEIYRTNTGALEVKYIDDYSFYRIEAVQSDQKLPSKSYKLYKHDQILAKRKALDLDDNQYLFDQLAEPYRDRLIMAMASPKVARSLVYNQEGQPLFQIED